MNCSISWFYHTLADLIFYSDSPLDLKIKGNMMCDLFSLTGKWWFCWLDIALAGQINMGESFQDYSGIQDFKMQNLAESDTFSGFCFDYLKIFDHLTYLFQLAQ